MAGQELRLFSPKGQASIEEVDMTILMASLSGREISTVLGTFGVGDFRGQALSLDDDTVFEFKHYPVPDTAEHPDVVVTEHANVSERTATIRELGHYGACELMLDGRRIIEHQVLSKEQ